MHQFLNVTPIRKGLKVTQIHWDFLVELAFGLKFLLLIIHTDKGTVSMKSSIMYLN